MRKKGILRRAVACLGMLLGCSGLAAAEIVVIPFSHEESDERPQAIVETSKGDLLVLSGVTEYDFSDGTDTTFDPQKQRSRTFLHIMRPDGSARRRIELPPSYYEQLVALGDGAAAWERSRTTPTTPLGRIVAINPNEGSSPRAIYQPNEQSEWLYLSSSPDAQALYIAERLRPFRMRMTKIDGTGRQVWQKTFEDADASNLTATDDGAILIRGVDVNTRASRRVVTRMSKDGEVLWDAPVSIEAGGVGTLLFQRTGFIAVADATHDERHRLTQFDVDTGRLVRSVFIPPFHRLRATRDGVLLWHQLMRQPYIAMLNDAGAVAWQRRFAAGDGVGGLFDGLITRSGRFAFLSEWREGPHGSARASLVITDRTALSLQNERGACARVDPLPVLEMERRLRRYHAVDISLAFDPQTRNRPQDRASCARPTDVDYQSFVREVAAKLGPDETLVDQMRQRVYTSVSAGDRPVRITHYALGSGASHSPERNIGVEARYDAGAQFVSYLNSTVLPHLARMQAFREQLFELTGCRIAVLADPDEAGTPRFLQDMEQAAQIVYARIAAVNPTEIDSVKQTQSCAGARLLMQHDAFGGSLDAMMPLESSGETFLRVIADARRGRQGTQR